MGRRRDEIFHRSAGNARQHGRCQGQLIVWCRDCRHRVEPDPAEHAARCGADLAVIDWVKRLKCSRALRRFVCLLPMSAG